MYVPLRTAAEHYNVSKQTIAAWADRGELDFIQLPSGHRRFKLRGNGNIEHDKNETASKNTDEKLKICYCRVSSHGQKQELQNQIDYMQARYPGWTVYTDIGSGLNWKRQSLRTVLRLCLQGDVSHVCVAHRDRLARFGYDILEFVMAQCGVKLLCDHQEAHVSKERELVDDILSIVTVFSARIHGQRHYQKNTQNHPEKLAGGTESHVDAVVRMLSDDVQQSAGMHQSRESAEKNVLLASE
jgi:predicted site-specific integrase-resolvase